MKLYYLSWIFSLLMLFIFSGAYGQMPNTGDYRSASTGNWSNRNNWQRYNGTQWVTPDNTEGYPGENASPPNVLIQNGHTIDINVSPSNAIGSLNVGVDGTESATLTFNTNPGASLTISGNVSVADGTFNVSSTGMNRSHSLTIGGNLTVVSGSNFNMTNGSNKCTVIFNKNGNQTVSGDGTIAFNAITLNMGSSRDNILDIQAVITMLNEGLTLNNGTFMLSSASTIKPLAPSADHTVIRYGATAGLWNNGGTINHDGRLVYDGLFRQSAGTTNIGFESGHELR